MAVTSRIAGCLPPVLVGGPTVNSSSKILVNSTGEPLSTAGQCRVVAWQTRSHCSPVSPRDSDLFLSQAAVRSHMTASKSSASHPTWASWKSKFKLMSRLVTSWPERGANPRTVLHWAMLHVSVAMLCGVHACAPLCDSLCIHHYCFLCQSLSLHTRL